MRIKTKKIKSSWGKIKGLMFSSPKNLAFIFKDEKQRTLHTFFVFFSIDLLFLNSKRRVIEKTKLKPFSFYTSKKKAKYIIELGKRKTKTINLGEKIIF